MRRTVGSVVSKNIIVLHFSTFSLFSHVFVPKTFPQELQSADLFVMIAMTIIVDDDDETQKEESPPNLLLHN